MVQDLLIQLDVLYSLTKIVQTLYMFILVSFVKFLYKKNNSNNEKT